jgi:hypothetical protein
MQGSPVNSKCDMKLLNQAKQNPQPIDLHVCTSTLQLDNFEENACRRSKQCQGISMIKAFITEQMKIAL